MEKGRIRFEGPTRELLERDIRARCSSAPRRPLRDSGAVGSPQLVFNGVVNGSLIGLLALAMVLVYRSTRVINSRGRQHRPRRSDAAPLPSCWITTSRTGSDSWSACYAGIAFAAVSELIVIRRLFDAPWTLVATVGIAQLAAGYAAYPRPRRAVPSIRCRSRTSSRTSPDCVSPAPSSPSSSPRPSSSAGCCGFSLRTTFAHDRGDGRQCGVGPALVREPEAGVDLRVDHGRPRLHRGDDPAVDARRCGRWARRLGPGHALAGDDRLLARMRSYHLAFLYGIATASPRPSCASTSFASPACST